MADPARGLRIAVLSDDSIEEFDPTPFLGGFDWEMHTLTAPVGERIRALADSRRFDLFLNLCEGHDQDGDSLDGTGYAGIEVVRALERCGVPYTGADSLHWDVTREEQQATAEAHGIPFATGFRVTSAEEAVARADRLTYPILAKHPQSWGSTGLLRESRAETLDELLRQVTRLCAAYGAARLESFIDGREFSVLVVDDPDDLARPIAYPVAELIFPPGEAFWHADLKWSETSTLSIVRVTDAQLSVRLQDVARRMYQAMGLAGCGRCDIRVDQAGTPIVLEMNANPGIMFLPEELGPADTAILFDPGGYPVFFDRLFRAALVRHRRSVG